jgi:hypothetical protein
MSQHDTRWQVTYLYQGQHHTLVEVAYSALSAKAQAMKRVAAPILDVRELAS